MDTFLKDFQFNEVKCKSGSFSLETRGVQLNVVSCDSTCSVTRTGSPTLEDYNRAIEEKKMSTLESLGIFQRNGPENQKFNPQDWKLVRVGNSFELVANDSAKKQLDGKMLVKIEDYSFQLPNENDSNDPRNEPHNISEEVKIIQDYDLKEKARSALEKTSPIVLGAIIKCCDDSSCRAEFFRKTTDPAAGRDGINLAPTKQ
jgi:hypothetical protein